MSSKRRSARREDRLAQAFKVRGKRNRNHDGIVASSTLLASATSLEVSHMPPRGVKGAKNKRMYEKIKKSAKSRGRSTKTAKRIAAATVNKQRSKNKRRRAAKKR
jgi:hypothetical protein